MSVIEARSTQEIKKGEQRVADEDERESKESSPRKKEGMTQERLGWVESGRHDEPRADEEGLLGDHVLYSTVCVHCSVQLLFIAVVCHYCDL